jgi:hypothetical protein
MSTYTLLHVYKTKSSPGRCGWRAGAWPPPAVLSMFGRCIIRLTKAEVDGLFGSAAGRAGPRATGVDPGGGPYRWAALMIGRLSPVPPRTAKSAATSSSTAAPASLNCLVHQPLSGRMIWWTVMLWTKSTALEANLLVR